MAGYAQTLAEAGLTIAQWALIRDLWLDALKASPYMEEYELTNMELGVDSAAYRFFTVHVMRPMHEAIADVEAFYGDPLRARLVK